MTQLDVFSERGRGAVRVEYRMVAFLIKPLKSKYTTYFNIIAVFDEFFLFVVPFSCPRAFRVFYRSFLYGCYATSRSQEILCRHEGVA